MAGSETRRNCGAAADLRCSPFRSLQQGGPPGDCRLAIRPDSRSGLKIWGITTFMPHSEPVVVAAGAENLFSFLLFYVALQRFDVLLESIHACRGNAAERAGHFSPKGLFDRDVAGFCSLSICTLRLPAEAPVCSRMKTKSASSTPRRIDITARRSSECSRGFSSLNIFCAIGS